MYVTRQYACETRVCVWLQLNSDEDYVETGSSRVYPAALSEVHSHLEKGVIGSPHAVVNSIERIAVAPPDAKHIAYEWVTQAAP